MAVLMKSLHLAALAATLITTVLAVHSETQDINVPCPGRYHFRPDVTAVMTEHEPQKMFSSPVAQKTHEPRANSFHLSPDGPAPSRREREGSTTCSLLAEDRFVQSFHMSGDLDVVRDNDKPECPNECLRERTPCHGVFWCHSLHCECVIAECELPDGRPGYACRCP